MATIASEAARADKRPTPLARAHVSLEELMRLKLLAKDFSFLPRQPVHSLLSGRFASRLRGRGLNFEELRRYVVGDDTRTIDWLATARLGIPHVRVYSEERDRPVLLIVDQRSSMFFGSRRAMKSVAAAEAAALAAWRAASLGDRVGAIVFGDRAIVDVPVRGRELGAVRVLSEIARQNQGLPGTEPTSAAPLLNQVLRRAVRLTTHDWLVCLITDAAGADEATLPLVTRIMEHNDLLVIFVEDPLEAALPNVGPAIFSSGGRQIEVDTSSHSLRERFAKQSAAWRNRLATLSKERAVPVLPISTHRDVAKQLRELIGERAARGPCRERATQMSDDPASLANLRDIVAPPLPSFWPPAAGLTIVAACALAFFAIKAAHVVRKARMNAYRRVAAAEIDRICAPRPDGDPGAVTAVSAVLKRAALVAYPREAVASLTGAGWASFIEKTGPGVGELKEFLSRACERALRLQPGDLSRLAEQARGWVREHRPFSSGG